MLDDEDTFDGPPGVGLAWRQVAVVLGGRSGTSALAGTLGLLGCRLPARLMPAHASNPRGHFEPQEIADLHDRLLFDAGRVWHDGRSFPAAWFETSAAASYSESLADLFRENYGDAALCVLKEPRMSRLLPLWKRVFAAVFAKPVFVFMHRHPFEVARSLQARDDSPLDRGLKFHVRSALAAERATRGSRRLVLGFGSFVANWRASVRRVRVELGLALNDDDERACRLVDELLQPDLRHHFGEDVSLDAVDQRLVAWAQTVYLQFCSLEQDAADPVAMRRLDEVSEAFDEFTAADPPRSSPG